MAVIFAPTRGESSGDHMTPTQWGAARGWTRQYVHQLLEAQEIPGAEKKKGKTKKGRVKWRWDIPEHAEREKKG